jgi:hypothetical protein
MTTPVPAAITATQQEACRENDRRALPIKVFAFDERLLVRIDAHPRFFIPPSCALIKLSSPPQTRRTPQGAQGNTI